MIDASKFDANLQALVTAISADVTGLINDTVPSPTSTYSSAQIDAKIDAKVASVGDVVNHGVTALQDAITETQKNLATLATQVGDISPVGLIDTDFVALYKSLRNIR